MPKTNAALTPVYDRVTGVEYDLKGPIAAYLKAVTAQWLLPTPDANPAILDIFRDRDRLPRRDLVAWAGEFAGKYITAAVQILRLTQDDTLRQRIESFVDELVSLQDEDGYLGPWEQDNRLTGRGRNVRGQLGGTWDAWGHYHIMLGLLLWHEDSGDAAALRCTRRIGDLLCERFLGQRRRGRRLVDTGSTEMNLAPIHALALLYRRTGTERYLALARQIQTEFGAQGRDGALLAGDYVGASLAGVPFFEQPKPRWESLHPIQGMIELHWLDGHQEGRRAFEHTWWSIAQTDRHNNGGFTSAEKAQGNPYHQGAIETCCTVAWAAMSIDMLRLTGSSLVADELELSTLNSGLGFHSASGRWVTYNTPMDGVRKASAHDIVFQSREGASELNCCSVNGPRILGMISDWALMREEGGLILNWYGPGSMSADVADTRVKLQQETQYPAEGQVRLRVQPERVSEFSLALRIPSWSQRTKVQVNGKQVRGVEAGTYLTLQRRWRRGDVIEVQFDMRPHWWVGERECKGLVSLYRGPLLLTYDRRYNDMDPDDVPRLDVKDLKLRRTAPLRHGAPAVLTLSAQAIDGRRVRLCDFASAGEGGSPYRSWLPVRNAGRVKAFSVTNPLRSQRRS
ncbi:MAG: hypothetical protein HN712_18945 [Gemmatimonadetes bacterium]|jgi:uncharacterized protein|nr:hypothetical protein [Gemmatimonadota bacterium]MBT6144974.1 hypothetical protein [Gemmatimonadota bacterium]MBT7862401.1 hypothetical protein [Gemmatimonadota bacterium]